MKNLVRTASFRSLSTLPIMISSLSSGRFAQIEQSPPDIPLTEPLVVQLIEAKPIGTYADRLQGVISDGVDNRPVLLTGLASKSLLSTGSILRLAGVVFEALEYRRTVFEEKSTFVIFKCRIIGYPTQTHPTHEMNPQQRNVPRPFFPIPSSTGPRPPPSPRQTFSMSLYAFLDPSVQGSSFGNVFQPKIGATRPLLRSPMGVGSFKTEQRPNVDREDITPLNALDKFRNRWVVIARCTGKSEMRKFVNQRGEGKLFTFDLLDAEEGQMRVTAFSETAVMFYDHVQVGKVYKISKGEVIEITNSRFKTFDSNYEIRLNVSSLVNEVSEENLSQPIPFVCYRFVTIDAIRDIEVNKLIDVLGIVMNVDPVRQITKRNGDITCNRNVLIRDNSNASIQVTLWEDVAAREGKQLEEAFQNGGPVILACSRIRVGDYGGRSLSTVSGSRLQLDPDIQEATALMNWAMQSKNFKHPVNALSQSGTVNARERCYLKDIHSLNVEYSKPSYFAIVGTIVSIREEKLYYAACPLRRQERVCMKKLSDCGYGNEAEDWFCESCSQNVETPDWRYSMDTRLQDFTDARYVTAFRCGDDLMAITAEELHMLRGTPEFKNWINRARFTTQLFVLKAAMQEWQGMSRIKLSMVRVEPIDPVRETKRLMDTFQEYSEMPVKLEANKNAAAYTPRTYLPQTPGNKAFVNHGFM